jgi:hypothetical protein
VLCGPLFVFSGVCVAQSLTFCVVLCGPLFVFSGVCVAPSLTFCVVLCGPLFVFSGVCVAFHIAQYRKLKIEQHKPH